MHRNPTNYNDPFDPTSPAFVHTNDLPTRPARHRHAVYGGARFATRDELRRFLTPPIDEPHTSRLDDVSVIHESADGALACLFRTPFHLTTDDRQKGVMVVGMPGGGKTRKLMLPLAISDIADPNKVVVFLANKGDETDILQAAVDRYRPGQKVRVVNLSKASRTTHAFNPFGPNDDPATALDDAIAYCAACTSLGSQHDSPFWEQSASRLIAATRLALRARYGKVSLPDVHYALEWPAKELHGLLAAHPDIPFASGVHSFLQAGGVNADTVLATAQGYLRMFRDPNLAAGTSAHELAWDAILGAPADRRGAVIVLETDLAALDKQRPVVNLFFAALFRAICRVAGDSPGCKLPRPACVYLDDFPAGIGRIPQCGQYFATLRSRDCRLTVAMQTTDQLYQFFDAGEARAIRAAFSTKIFVPPVDIPDAAFASELSGTTTVSIPRPRRRRTGTPVGRLLLTPDEVRLPPDHFFYGRACVAFLPNTPPVYLWAAAIHDSPEWGPVLNRLARSSRRSVLRDKPLVYAPPTAFSGVARVGASFTNTTGWSELQLVTKITEVKKFVGCDAATDEAKCWWRRFEADNKGRLGVILRLLEEIAARKATVTDYATAAAASKTDRSEGVLALMEYARAVAEDERKKREATAGGTGTTGKHSAK